MKKEKQLRDAQLENGEPLPEYKKDRRFLQWNKDKRLNALHNLLLFTGYRKGTYFHKGVGQKKK
ncbi:MAG: hypothetical protein CV087_17410 [Candidatus Brocadia sp. WS118]|nr:MAG: hypothetical protein CV087_17410 [Candidatus Brocadia sp. WS118]